MQTLGASLEFLGEGVLGVGQQLEIDRDAVLVNNVDAAVAVIQVDFDFGISATLPLDSRLGEGRGSEFDLVEIGVVSDELFEVVDDEAVLGVFGVVGGEGRELGGREEAGEAAAAAGGRGGVGEGVGLAEGAGALVEESGVDIGSEEIMGGA